MKFKEHFIADLARPVETIVSQHHRYYARQALKKVQVEVASEPLAFLEEWVELYQCLIGRHGIGGFRAFSRDSFARQLAVPGMTLVRATVNARGVATHLYYSHGNVQYSHLAACSPEGYATNAMYAVYLRSLEHFVGKARWLDWGGSAGVTEVGNDGLTQFKRGWSTSVRQVYFCGLTLDPAQYEALTRYVAARPRNISRLTAKASSDVPKATAHSIPIRWRSDRADEANGIAATPCDA